MSIDGLSLSPLVDELNQKLTGGRIDKIFQIDPYELLIWVRQPGENLRLIISAHPEHARIHLTEKTPLNPPTPPAFCMLLRKHLEDGRISGIRQFLRDRVVTIDIDVRGEHGLILTKQLTAELMGKHSNILFLHSEVIIDAIRRVGPSQSRYRQLLPGKIYVSPPGQDRLDPLLVPPPDFIRCVRDRSGPLVKAIISAGIGIGPISAKECVYLAGLSPEATVESLDENQVAELTTAFTKLILPLKSGHPKPTVTRDENGCLSGIAAFPLTHLRGQKANYFETMSEAVEFAEGVQGVRPPQEKLLLNKLIHSELTKLLRKRDILTAEAADAQTAEEYRRKADILMAFLYQTPERTTEIDLPDLYSENAEGSSVTISLDPMLSPIENANRYYLKYNKLKRAQDLLAKQLIQNDEEISYLESLTLGLDNASSQEELSDIRQELIAAGYLKEVGKKRAQPALSSPFTYITEEGFVIQVGKNNRQNDHLTFKQSQSEDIWLHTKDIPGSHVLIRTNGIEPSAAVLQQAAQLAAYYSKSRQSSKVPVDFTKRRFVRKPPGAKPGFVIYDHQNTLYVTPDETKIKNMQQKK